MCPQNIIRRQSRLSLITGAAVIVAVITAIACLTQGRSYTMVLPWFIPATGSLLFVIATSVAFLAFGRYRVTWHAPSLWIGIGSYGFAVAMLFNMLTFPGLLPGGRQILGRLPNTAVWEGTFALSWLGVSLLVAPISPWPGEWRRGRLSWRCTMAMFLLVVVALHLLFVLMEEHLPLVIGPSGSFTPLFRAVNGLALGVVSAAGSAISIRRTYRTADAMTGYMAVCQLALVAVAVLSWMEVRRWDLFWYIQRFFWAGGFLTMFYGLLSEYVSLFRLEKERSEELAKRSAELKKSEEELRRSEATLRTAIDATGLGTFDFNPRTGELLWSDRAKYHFGLSPSAPTDYHVYQSALHPEDRERVKGLLQQALDPAGGGTYQAEYRTIGLEDGKERWLIARGQVFFDDDGTAVRVVGATLDITERKRSEEELRKARDLLEERVQERTVDLTRALRDLEAETHERIQAVEELRSSERLLIHQSRLAAMGEMLVNISHQWRQPLNVLNLLLQSLGRSQERGQLTKELLEKNINRAGEIIEHMSGTIDDFSNYLSPDRVELPFSLRETVEKTVSMIAETLRGIEVDQQVDDDPSVVGYRNEYAQVLINILTNARDALLEKGAASPRIRIRIFSERGKGVVIIADNAGGIAPEVMDRIFEPYFTTKPGKGTGIGLFMSKNIIEKTMGGSLTARNTDEGAEFRIEV